MRLANLPQYGRDFLKAQVYIEQSLQPRFPDVHVVELQEAWRDILKRARLVQHHRITREELSVREYMSMVLKTLQGRRFVEFEELFEPEKGSTVLVVTFIALLELAKETLIEITQAGVAPVLYAERSGNRAETNTHFHRERNTISFSASTLSYPRLGGEQDRASIIWHLAALGRTNPALFQPGEDLSIFVAGVRNAAPWRIYMIGEEDVQLEPLTARKFKRSALHITMDEVQLDAGSVKAWHVKSVPQQGGYEKTFDIWFAPGYEYYPVKLRQTEVSGDYLELTLSNLIIAQQ